MTGTQIRLPIRVGRTEMDFKHNGRLLTAVHPFYGPANSLAILNQIMDPAENPAEYRAPTSGEVVSFVHEYSERHESQAKVVKGIIKESCIRGFTGVLYVPESREKGVAHFIDFPKFDARGAVDRDDLVRRLDDSRAQVPFEHMNQTEIDWYDIAKNPYCIAFADGQEGAEKLAELASNCPGQKAVIMVPGTLNLTEPIARVTSLRSVAPSLFSVYGLHVDSNLDGGGNYGHSFGVLDK